MTEPAVTPAIDLSDDDLVAELVTHIHLHQLPRVRELHHQILHRLKFRAARLTVHEDETCGCCECDETLDLARANGALAARVEVMAVLAGKLDESGTAPLQEGLTAALVAVAGMK